MEDGTGVGSSRTQQPSPGSDSAPAAVRKSLTESLAELAGEPWTDRPSCVHPTLGAVARAIDEHSSAAGRAFLLPLAPELIGTAGRGFETPARLVAVCVSTALASPESDRITADDTERLHAAQRTALYLLGARRGEKDDSHSDRADEPGLCGTARWWLPALGAIGLSEPFYRCFVAERQVAFAVEVAARASDDECDLRLRQLLKWCTLLTVSGECAAAPHGEDHAARTYGLRDA